MAVGRARFSFERSSQALELGIRRRLRRTCPPSQIRGWDEILPWLSRISPIAARLRLTVIGRRLIGWRAALSLMRYEYLIGLRYLRARRRERFVSLIAIISMAGVAIGTFALTVVLSVMSGFQEDLRARLLAFNPEITVETSG